MVLRISCQPLKRQRLSGFFVRSLSLGLARLDRHICNTRAQRLMLAEYESNLRYFLRMGIHSANDYVIVFNQVIFAS